MKKSQKIYARKGQHRAQVVTLIRQELQKATGLTLEQLREQHNEKSLFFEAFRHVTTTKKAMVAAIEIPVEAGCRYKRMFEEDGLMVQSKEKYLCPFTKYKANLLTANPDEFGNLTKTNTNQLPLF